MILQCGTNDNHSAELDQPPPLPACPEPECQGLMRPPDSLARLREHARQEYS